MAKWIVLGVLALLPACGMLENKSAIEVMPDVARNINESGTAEFAKIFPNATMNARVDNGDTMVLIMGNMPLGNETYDPMALQKLLRPKLCATQNFRDLIAEGGKIRVEMTSNFGKQLPAIQFTRC